MDAFLSPEMMRMYERIIVVIGGVVSIWLGYKLFSHAHIRQDGSGKWKSALFEVSFTRIGPGVFFALFGVYVLATSLNRPIDLSTVERPINVIALPQLEELGSIINKLPESEEKKQALELISKMQVVRLEKSYSVHMQLYVPEGQGRVLHE